MREDERLERVLRDATSVLFLCSGNMIRSAFAELYARHLGCALPVRSAATTYRNDAIYPQARAALLTRGVPAQTMASFRPTVLLDIRAKLDSGIVVFGMTADHLDSLGSLGERGFLLPLLDGSSDEIADPMFEGGFDATFDRIAELVDVLVDRLL